jgi:hypothetical protein
MIEEFLEEALACRSEREFWRLHMRAEAQLTPLEIDAMRIRAHRLPELTRTWLEGVAAYGGFTDAAPQCFWRRRVAGDIDLYCDPSVPAAEKCLVLAFCGSAHRLMMPIPCTLQYLPADRCDVVVLRDQSHMHYVNGIRPYASSFFDLVRKLAVDLRVPEYMSVSTYGTSMGGFVALRCGIILNARRAISVGGTSAWQPPRLVRNDFPAFDLLCQCNAKTKTTLYCCYPADHGADAAAAAHIASFLPVRQVPIANTSAHNVIFELWRRNQLAAFYGRIFDFYEREDNRRHEEIGTLAIPTGTLPAARL